MNDLLREAVASLRDELPREQSRARVTRARIMTSLHRASVRRARGISVLLPLAATLAAASAWATGSGEVTQWVESCGQVLGLTEHVEPAAPAVASDAAPPTRRGSAAAVRAAAFVPPADLAPAAEEHVEVTPPPPSAAPTPPKVRSRSSSVDASHELYRVAHRTHFSERNFSAALDLWNRYLGVAPRGRFAAEARYNRALCLIRLGHTQAARAALQPFANGELHAYRQREATELLDALTR